MLLKDKVSLGYELNELIRLAVGDEGMLPVVLTARVLRSLTSHSFTWHPGSKVHDDKINTDLDILACCNGTLITGECKSLPHSAGRSTWLEIIKQLLPAIEVAKKCDFKVFFISSLVDDYPKYFMRELKKIAGKELNLLFITGQDLERGFCEVSNGNEKPRQLDMYTLLNSQKRLRKRKSKSSPRTIVV